MQRTWSADELSERWSLLPEDLALLAGRIDAGKLGFAVQLAFWRQHGRFPDPLCQGSCRLNRFGTFGGADSRKWLDTDKLIRIG
jgi:hypothetical protein